MKYSIFLIAAIIAVANANLYGVWQDSAGDANFGLIDTTSGDATMKLEFPSFANWIPGNSAMNNFTSTFTFVLNYASTDSKFLVSINVATNKVIYFANIAEGATPYGLRYDSDVNSLKCVLKTEYNNTWIVGEMDPASASYDIYDTISGSYISSGLSPYNHSYYFVYGDLSSGAINVNSYDTRTGYLTDQSTLYPPSNFVGGPFNLLYVPSMDILVGTALFSDSNNNVGSDYVLVDIQTGSIKPMGIFQPSQTANVISHAAHHDTIYASVNFGGAGINFISFDLNSKALAAEVVTNDVISMGYFTNV